MHIHNFGQTLKIQNTVVTLNIRSRSSKSTYLNTVSMQGWCSKIHWFRRQSSEKAEITVFRDGDHENEVTMKTRSNHQTHINPLFCHNDIKTLARILCSIQEISYKKTYLGQNMTFKVLV